MPNMEKIFILGSSKTLQDLGNTYIEVPTLINEIEIHNWVVELFRKSEIEAVVIEVGENPLLALQIGYHIRLSIPDLFEKVLIPIFFISRLSLNSVLIQSEIFSQILATKGIFFSEFDLQTNKEEIKHLSGLTESEYLTKFLKIIHIEPDEKVGRHSLANVWGAHAMDKAANANALPADSEFKKKLYFKYIS